MTRPTLPPRDGYVEVEGKYVPVPATVARLKVEEEMRHLSEQAAVSAATSNALAVLAAQNLGVDIPAEELEAAEETLVTKARGEYTSAPEQGAPWSPTQSYIVGDEAAEAGNDWEAIHYSRNKRPSESPEHWALKTAAVYPNWNDLTGFIEKGVRCVYPDGDGIDTVWECQLAHNKFSTFKPKDGSDQWARVT